MPSPPRIGVEHHAAAAAVVAAAVARTDVEELGAEGKPAQARKGPYRLEVPGPGIVAQAAAGYDRVLAVEGVFRHLAAQLEAHQVGGEVQAVEGLAAVETVVDHQLPEVGAVAYTAGGAAQGRVRGRARAEGGVENVLLRRGDAIVVGCRHDEAGAF